MVKVELVICPTHHAPSPVTLPDLKFDCCRDNAPTRQFSLAYANEIFVIFNSEKLELEDFSDLVVF